MTEPVKRPYDSSRRRAQAARTRAAVLDAARRTFLERGYTATTIATVATAAGVSVDTIYKQFRGKAGLLKAVYDVAVVGDDEPVPFAERAAVRGWATEPDARRIVREYCAQFAVASARVAPMVLLIRSAGDDPDARRLAGEIRAERLRGMEMFAAHLDARGLLRPGVDAGTARDVLWLYTAPESYEMLVLDRGWSLDRFGAFLAEAVTAALLPDPGRPEGPASGLEQPKGPAVPNGTTGPVGWS